MNKKSSVGTIESLKENRKLFISSYLFNDERNLIPIISATNPPHNVPKKTNPDTISISEHYKQYSNHKSINTAHVSCKP